MHQLASVEKDETVANDEVHERQVQHEHQHEQGHLQHRASSCHCKSTVNEDEREEETQALNCYHFTGSPSPSQYNASISLLKNHVENVTSQCNSNTTTLTRDVDFVQRNGTYAQF